MTLSVKIIQGNILDSGADYICHQVNCRGAMNSGVAKAIRQEYPIVFTEYYNSAIDLDADDFTGSMLSWEHMFGHIQVIPVSKNAIGKGCIVNMFAQDGYGYDGRRYTSYDAFWSCLGEIKNKVPKGRRIAFPSHIGCVRGGANWKVIETMIIEVLGEDYEVEFWRLDNG